MFLSNTHGSGDVPSVDGNASLYALFQRFVRMRLAFMLPQMFYPLIDQEVWFARSVAVARMPHPRGQKQMVLSRRESTSQTDRTKLPSEP
jgi:hypothetical protein